MKRDMAKRVCIVATVAVLTLTGWVPLIDLSRVNALVGQISTSTETAGGLRAVKFTTPQGNIWVNLPDDIAGGDTISGTVATEPAGKSQNEKDANGLILSGYVVDVQEKRTPVSEKTGLWQVPDRATSMVVTLRTPSGREVSISTVPVARPEPTPITSRTAASGNFDIPSVGRCGLPATISGPFAGDLKNTAVLISGRPAVVAAESPRKAIFRIPDDAAGPAEIQLKEGPITAVGAFRGVSIRAPIGNENLRRGETRKVTVSVTGLRGLTEPIDITIENLSPTVIRLTGSAVQHFRIGPNDVSGRDDYTIPITFTGIVDGNFLISIKVVGPALDRLDLGQSVLRALAEWQRDTGIAITPEAQLSIVRSVREAKPQLGRLLAAQGEKSNPESLLRSLIRNYCFDLRDYKRGFVGRRTLRPPTRWIQSFQPRAPQEPAEITVADIDLHPFVTWFLSWFSTTPKTGNLEVSSTPDSASIQINGKARGLTNKSFVMPIGGYSVLVKVPGNDCQRDVQVLQNDVNPPTRVVCP